MFNFLSWVTAAGRMSLSKLFNIWDTLYLIYKGKAREFVCGGDYFYEIGLEEGKNSIYCFKEN